jgi:hypothetical protein
VARLLERAPEALGEIGDGGVERGRRGGVVSPCGTARVVHAGLLVDCPPGATAGGVDPLAGLSLVS